MDPYGPFDHLQHYHRLMMFQPYARINPFPTPNPYPHPPSPTTLSPSASGHHSLRSVKTKICGVCGDRAKSYHFGGISCDSCKGEHGPKIRPELTIVGFAAFFRRSVQNDAYKNFHCPYEGQCDINMSSRKCCQYCR